MNGRRSRDLEEGLGGAFFTIWHDMVGADAIHLVAHRISEMFTQSHDFSIPQLNSLNAGGDINITVTQTLPVRYLGSPSRLAMLMPVSSRSPPSPLALSLAV